MNYFKSENSLQTEKNEQVKIFLVFNLELEEYAIDILNVQEIHRYENVSLIYNAPAYLKGFMSLRDNIIPIIDLRILYNLEGAKYTESTIVIILNVEQKLLGIVLNETPEIVYIKEAQLKLITDFCSKIPQIYVKSIGVIEKRSIIVLDVEKLVTHCCFEDYKEA